ncbi:MAG: DUF4743 domain-containing protein [Phycisphaerales bacterium JB040]
MTAAERGFRAHLDACNAHDLSRYLPWSVGERRVGWIRRDRAARFLAGRAGFEVDAHGVRSRDPAGSAALQKALDALSADLLAAGEPVDRTGELFAVSTRPRGEVVALLDRGVVPWFGVIATGVHLDGFVRKGGELHLWIARRSRKKLLHPGKLDKLVAGGQPHGLSLQENLITECAEEASLPPELARRAVATGSVSYRMESERGIKPDTMFTYELELPADFTPCNADGEVEAFELLPAEEVARLVRETDRFKFNCNLVLLSFFLRHDLLPDPPAELAALRAALQPDGARG